MKQRHSNWILLVIPSLLLIAGWFAFGPIGGRLGQDYYREIPRMLAGSLHFWQNGFAVPHFSPSFCGGIPIFADPQSSYYSLPQFLAFALDPMVAIRISLLIFYALGYLFTFLWLRHALEYENEVSHFGALLFVLNGFVFAHLFVGHLTHHSYLLCPALLYFLCKKVPDSWRRQLTDACLFSLIWIYTIYSGGFHMLVLFTVLTGLALPLVSYKRSFKETFRWFATLGGALVLALLLVCSGKLVAISRYSPHFYRMPFNLSPDNPWVTSARYFWSNPWDVPSTIRFGKYSFGVWEFLGFVSKLTLLGPAYLLFRALRQNSKKEIVFASIFAVVIAFVCFLATGRADNEQLPFFKMYHNPIKLLGALIPFLIWALAASLSDLLRNTKWLRDPRWRVIFFLALSIGVCVEEWDHFSYYVSNRTGLDYTYDPKIYADLKQRGTLPPIKRVEASLGGDTNAAIGGYSSLACYEPVFGYRWEGLLTSVRPGDVFAITEGRFNMNQPGCLLYPEFYHCRPWDRVKESERENLRQFLAGNSSAWPIPGWQTGLLVLNAIFLLLCISIPAMELLPSTKEDIESEEESLPMPIPSRQKVRKAAR
jgi:hypothetical protein